MTTPNQTALETMNGYTIIASQPTTAERIILAVRPAAHSPSGFEYVTAAAPLREDGPHSWYWGHYLNDLHGALADFDLRVAAYTDTPEASHS